ncbi:MAG: hypothetical protein MUF13_00325 [Akkermansiaceae bacterium]|jgi:hypothetical protein|nr:hypothetical protein [Akkermansiaceae bacterium]
MRTTIRIPILPPRPDKESPLATRERYHEIAEFCRENQLSDNIPSDLDKSEYGFHARFDNNEHDPRLKVIFEMLGEMGRQVFPKLVPKGSPPRSLAWNIVRYYSKKDLEKFDFFKLEFWSTKKSVRLPIATDTHGAFVGYRASAIGSKKWSLPFMAVDLTGDLAVNETGKALLESSGLKGLGFEEIKWLDPENAKGQFFLFRPDSLMPLCLSSLVQGDYDEYFFVEGPDFSPVLRFSRKAVEEREKFDCALTMEKQGCDKSPGGRKPIKIISRRFRDFLIENKIYFDVAPIILVD